MGDSGSNAAHVVVVGAGQAAQSLIESLRKHGFHGAVTLFGDEPIGPYQRPPLSKKYLLGEMARDRLQFRPDAWYVENEVRLRTGEEVARIDRDARRVATLDGSSVPYDLLALTTGAAPRRLPARIGGALGGVYVVRDLADVDAAAPSFKEGRRLLVVGGGYIGLEAAAVAAQLGLRVTLVEAAERILARVACADTAAYFTELHTKKGVDIRTGAALSQLEGDEDGQVVAAHFADRSTLEVDFVVVGIGVAPRTSLAEAAGLKIDNGIFVDGLGHCSDRKIFAAGDCASHLWRGAVRRIESVQNAIDQGAVVGQSMAKTLNDGPMEPGEGMEDSYRPEPWFWSDQFDVKLQIAGLGDGATDFAVRPGPRPGAQSVWYFKRHDWGENLVAVDAMNDPKAYMAGKRMLALSQTPDRARIADPELKPMDLII